MRDSGSSAGGADLYRQLAESVDEIVLVTELGGRMLYANSALTRQTGYTAADFQFGQADNPFLHRDDAARVGAFIQSFLASGEASSAPIENRISDRWGTTRWFRSVLARVVYDGQTAIQFVTRPIPAPEAVHALADRDIVRDYRILVENAGDGIAKLDARGRFLFANQTFLDLVERDVVALGHVTIGDLVATGEDPAKFLEPGRFESRFRRTSGEIAEVDVVVTPLLPSGELMALVRDVTEKRRLERELAQREKLQSLGLLAGGVAHDLNNFLAVVRTNNNLAQIATRSGHAVDSYLEEIKDACAKAASLCMHLLAATGRAPTHRAQIELGEMVREMVSLLRTTIPAPITVELRTTRQVFLSGDVAALQPLVMNLVRNAVDALPDGYARGRDPDGASRSRIEIEVDEVDCDARMLADLAIVAGLGPGRAAYIRVTDHGIGMDEATRARMFEPFFTTKSAGHGLGLSSVVGTVRAHGGAIGVTSHSGVGTTITVYLPLAAANELAQPPEPPDALRSEPPVRSAPRPKEPALAEGDRSLILVADDEEALRRSLTLLLTALGYRTVDARNGLEAVEVVRARGSEIAAALVDASMPQMGGHDAVREMRRLRSDLPVVMMTGYARLAHPMPGVEVLTKPFEPEVLQRLLHDVIRRSRPPQAARA